ncbi:Hypothetical protein PHPALM_458 [Phytophthora palmivora]|uniref:Uncharacterized protein n=1 Tax=Phytophthora palmivora TaxID=4796 RepID=A0A2P4YUR8_9STRA|nr:Hypothetical protein PHPALM_458 [Phytophthora palmivora]
MVDHIKPDAVTLTHYVPIGNDDNTEDRVKVSIKTFSSGDTVEWLTWLKSFERLIRLKGWGQDGPTLFLNARIVLRDMALDIFNTAAAKVEGATPQIINTVMMQVAREFLVQDAREHLIDMIRNRRKARDVPATEHLATMRHLSTLITTLPENDAPVSEKTLMYYFRKSLPLDWQTKYEESGREAPTLTELARYFTRLEMNSERKDPRSHLQRDKPRPSNLPKHKPNKDTRKPAKSDKPAKPATGKWCSHHRTNTHSDEECHYQQKKRAAEFNYCELPDGDFEELNAVTEIADPKGPPEVAPATKHKCKTIVV